MQNKWRIVTVDSRTDKLRPEFCVDDYPTEKDLHVGDRIIIEDHGDNYDVHAQITVVDIFKSHKATERCAFCKVR